jgi:hypothetical protein
MVKICVERLSKSIYCLALCKSIHLIIIHSDVVHVELELGKEMATGGIKQWF